jgi:uncharacterized protein involved in exopolysaccharide biosynthesis
MAESINPGESLHPLKRAVEQVIVSVFRHKKKILIFQAVILTLTFLAIVYWPRKYQSDARLFVQIGRETLGLDPTATTGQTISMTQLNRDAEIKSVIETIRSRAVLKQVVDRVGLETILDVDKADGRGSRSILTNLLDLVAKLVVAPISSLDPVSPEEKAVVELEDNLYVHSERDSTVIYIAFQARSPVVARKIASAVVDAYSAFHPTIHRNARSLDFFAGEKERLEEELNTTMNRMRDMKNEIGLASIEGHRAKLEAQLSITEGDIFETERSIATTEGRIAGVQQQLAHLPARSVSTKVERPNDSVDLLQQQLYALQMQQWALESKLAKDDPRIKMIHNQVDDAQAKIAEESPRRFEITDDINPIHQQLSLELAQQEALAESYRQRHERLVEQRQEIISQIAKSNEYEVVLDVLKRQSDVARNKFQLYSEHLEQARVDRRLEEDSISNIKVIQPAQLWEKPVSPSKVLLILGGLLFAATVPVGIAVTMDLLDNSARTEQDVERVLGVSVFGAIPRDSLHGQPLSVG